MKWLHGVYWHFLTNGPSPFLLHGQVNDIQNNFNSKTAPNIKRWVPALQVDKKSNDFFHIGIVNLEIYGNFMSILSLEFKACYFTTTILFFWLFFPTVSLGLGQKENKDSWPWNLWSPKISDKVKSTDLVLNSTGVQPIRVCFPSTVFHHSFESHRKSPSRLHLIVPGKCWEIPSRSAGMKSVEGLEPEYW